MIKLMEPFQKIKIKLDLVMHKFGQMLHHSKEGFTT